MYVCLNVMLPIEGRFPCVDSSECRYICEYMVTACKGNGFYAGTVGQMPLKTAS